ncbi:major facilitator superfamily domain-containing protein [Aspergillus cavernicola]|uniref:Major facilitator superfamily domain-containing protein n=1 Tax=Aspergillus cavernicola TaxID=176166 RepID=A0ABR4HM66_9EURO
MDDQHTAETTSPQLRETPSETKYTAPTEIQANTPPSTSSSSLKDAQEPPHADVEAGVSPTDQEWISGAPLLMVFSGVTLVVFLVLLDTSIVATAVPRITNQFHSLEDVAWYGSAYTLASCALQPLTGKFYTHFTTKIMFLAFFAIFELGSLICGVATSSMMLIIGRAVAGIGSSGIINGSLTIIAGSVPMHKRPALIGIMLGLSQLGLVLGPLIGGAFTTYTTWRWCFFINLPIGGLVSILLVFTRIPEQRKKGKAIEVLPNFFKTFDLIGFTLFAPAAIMLLLALEYGGTKYPWNDSRVIGLFCGAGATAIVFLAWEYRKGKEAMIPFHLLTPRIAYSSYLTMGAGFGLTMVSSYYLPIYFQAVRDDSALISGVNLLPNILAQLVTAVLSGVLVGKLGYYLPWAIGGSSLAAIGSGLLGTLSPTTSTAAWAGYQVLVGFGRGAATQIPMIAVQNYLSPDDMSTGMAILTFGQTFGGSVFLAIANVIFSEGLKDQIPRYAPNVAPDDVIGAGATGFRDIVSEADLEGVLKGYSNAVDWVFYLVAGICVMQFCTSWGMGWIDIRKGKKGDKKDEKEDEKEDGKDEKDEKDEKEDGKEGEKKVEKDSSEV